MSNTSEQIDGMIVHAQRLLDHAERIIALIAAREIPNILIPMPDGSSHTLKEDQEGSVENYRRMIARLTELRTTANESNQA